jgi:hypothetical protein
MTQTVQPSNFQEFIVITILLRVADYPELTDKWESNQRPCEVQPFSSGCSEMLRVFPSGSLNQATFAPVGEVQMHNSS